MNTLHIYRLTISSRTWGEDTVLYFWNYPSEKEVLDLIEAPLRDSKWNPYLSACSLGIRSFGIPHLGSSFHAMVYWTGGANQEITGSTILQRLVVNVNVPEGGDFVGDVPKGGSMLDLIKDPPV